MGFSLLTRQIDIGHLKMHIKLSHFQSSPKMISFYLEKKYHFNSPPYILAHLALLIFTYD